jgi:ArsR family transcriptional regulator
MRICGIVHAHSELFAALADETRLRMLVVLHRLGELCSCDLETGLEVTQSRASRHLTTLRRAGLVSDRRDGAFVYFRLAEPLPTIAEETLAALFRDTARSAQAKADVARTRAERRSPCC